MSACIFCTWRIIWLSCFWFATVASCCLVLPLLAGALLDDGGPELGLEEPDRRYRRACRLGVHEVLRSTPRRAARRPAVPSSPDGALGAPSGCRRIGERPRGRRHRRRRAENFGVRAERCGERVADRARRPTLEPRSCGTDATRGRRRTPRHRRRPGSAGRAAPPTGSPSAGREGSPAHASTTSSRSNGAAAGAGGGALAHGSGSGGPASGAAAAGRGLGLAPRPRRSLRTPPIVRFALRRRGPPPARPALPATRVARPARRRGAGVGVLGAGRGAACPALERGFEAFDAFGEEHQRRSGFLDDSAARTRPRARAAGSAASTPRMSTMACPSVSITRTTAGVAERSADLAQRGLLFVGALRPQLDPAPAVSRNASRARAQQVVGDAARLVPGIEQRAELDQHRAAIALGDRAAGSARATRTVNRRRARPPPSRRGDRWRARAPGRAATARRASIPHRPARRSRAPPDRRRRLRARRCRRDARRSARSSSSVNSKCWVRDRIVGSTCSGFVVASTNTTWSGGSSRLLSNVFAAASVSMWTSSRMYTFLPPVAPRNAIRSRSSRASLTPRFDAASSSKRSRKVPLAIASQCSHTPHGSPSAPQVQAVERLGQDARRGGLPGAARPAEEVRVADPVLAHGVAQRRRDVVLADQLAEPLRSVLAVQRLIRHCRRC